MALVLADRVQETTTTTGTGTVALLGASVGYQSFSAVGDGNTTYYTIAGQTTSEWEVGIGTYTASGTTLSRTTVLSSSNSGSLVNFTAGTKNVFVTYPAGRSVYVNGTTVTPTNSGILPVANGGTNASTASITAFNNITGYTASGATGTTSTNLVFSTSPTLVTPALGTPSSGTLTNCTFPTLNQNTTGSAATLTTARAIYGNNFDGSAALAQVIASTYGGTGNGFTKFSGPTTAEKTFTLPDASSTIVVQGGALGTPSSGTLTNCTFPTLNQNTTGSAATFTSTSQNSQFNSIGVGTAASATAGEIRATNNVTAYYSDIRLKTKVGDIVDPLGKVRQIETLVYHANETAVELGYDASVIEVGVSAQSVQAVQPEAVAPAPIDDKYLTVRYERLVPLLLESVKALEDRIIELEAKLKG
jgi:hypothetical protein